MKRMLILLMLPFLFCGLGGCTLSNQTYYHRAQLYLGSGNFDAAAQLFSQLGEYEDAAESALYSAALEALAQDQLSLAKATFTLIEPFKSSSLYLRYIAAAELESSGKLEDALAAFESLGVFEDSQARVNHLHDAIPLRDISHARALMDASRWEQALTLLEALNGYGESPRLIAQCREKMSRAAYDQAVRLYDERHYEQALTAFEALGETLDAPARARMCRSAMYHQLEAEFPSASMDTAQSLMDRYGEMEDYLESPRRLQELQSRFAVNLRLSGETLPYVRFGSGLTWRVLQVRGSQATLLAQTPLFSTFTDLPAVFSAEESAAILSGEYPRLVISLDRYAFTQGSGTPADPYQ